MKVPDGWASGRRWDGTCQSSRVSPIGDSSELDPLGSRSASYYYNLVSAPSGQITTITLRDGAPDRLVNLYRPRPRYKFTRRSRGEICNQNRPIALAAITDVDEPPTGLGLD